uniref:Uncharacterized protein n=1 Tax=Neogobius melanostomus TaxID=47308 RepID=A0A8C6WF65_9GOBI
MHISDFILAAAVSQNGNYHILVTVSSVAFRATHGYQTCRYSPLFFSFSFSYFLFHCSAVSSRLMEAVFLMVFALSQRNIIVDLVSASL